MNERVLRGRTVLVTRPRESSRELRRRLLEAGARVIELPLVAIDHGGPTLELDVAIERLSAFAWIVFTSAHGVAAFWRRLRVLRKTGKVPRRVRAAAVGAATAKALRRRGVRSVLVPREETARGLLSALRKAIRGRARILLPRSDLAPRTLPDGLRRMGHEVHAVVAYRTVTAPRPEPAVVRAARAADALLLLSPSAVHGLRREGLRVPRALVACIGATTAAAARRAGLQVDVVPAEATTRAIVEALGDAFALPSVLLPERVTSSSSSGNSVRTESLQKLLEVSAMAKHRSAGNAP